MGYPEAQRNLQQNKRLHYLLNKFHIEKDQKEDMVYKLTLGRTKSTKDLSRYECDRLIKELQNYTRRDPLQSMRRKIFSICHELGWHIPGSMKVDESRMHAWLLKYGHKHKPLMQYTDAGELATLVTQFENMLSSSYRTHD